MLPGFRFLFAAIVFSMSILIFGLGAAALLRAAHEEFANLPSRRSTPEPMFARRTDETPPTLALLRIDVPEKQPAEAAEAAPAPDVVADVPAQAEKAPEGVPVEVARLAALRPAEAPSESQPTEATPNVPAEAAVPAATMPSPEPRTVAAGQADAIVAAVALTPEPAAAAPLPPAPAPDFTSFEDNPAATRIATLGGPAVIVDEKAAAAASEVTVARTIEAKPDRSAIRKRAAERARERRQIAARRARVAREASMAQQQLQANPFTQLPFPGTTTTR